MSLTLAVDLSEWESNVDYGLLKASGVECAIVKATQGNYYTSNRMREHVIGAAQAGLIVGLYLWNDPTVSDVLQARYFMDQCADLPYAFAAVDVEQHWRDWGEWRKWRRGEIPKLTKLLSAERIDDSARMVSGILKLDLKKPVLVYTRATFVLEHARTMLAWLGSYPVWWAQWPFQPYAPGEAITWDELRGKTAEFTGPWFPRGWDGPADWAFWQFTGERFILPGMAKAKADVNYFNGDLAALRGFCGLGEGTTPEPEEEQSPPSGSDVPRRMRCVRQVRVRSRPDASSKNIVGVLEAGDGASLSEPLWALEVEEDGADIWARIGWRQWCAMRYRGVVYLEYCV